MFFFCVLCFYVDFFDDFTSFTSPSIVLCFEYYHSAQATIKYSLSYYIADKHDMLQKYLSQ